MIKLPTDPVIGGKISPGVLILYSLPKTGKSTLVAELTTKFAPGKALILSLHPSEYRYLTAVKEEISSPVMFNQYLDAIEKAGKPYDFIIVDTITILDEWSETMGTYEYMEKMAGKAFNRSGSKKYNHNDPEWESVHTLGPPGYQYSRSVMLKWYDKLERLAPHVILLSHVKDKYIASKSGEAVESIEISLTGKVKNIYCSRADAIGYLTAKGKERYISFQADSNSIMGARPEACSGLVKISEETENGIVTFWDSIYPDYK